MGGKTIDFHKGFAEATVASIADGNGSFLNRASFVLEKSNGEIEPLLSEKPPRGRAGLSHKLTVERGHAQSTRLSEFFERHFVFQVVTQVVHRPPDAGIQKTHPVRWSC